MKVGTYFGREQGQSCRAHGNNDRYHTDPDRSAAIFSNDYNAWWLIRCDLSLFDRGLNRGCFLKGARLALLRLARLPLLWALDVSVGHWERSF
jgi:hypothetical protein